MKDETIALIVSSLCMVGLGGYLIWADHQTELSYIQHGYCKRYELGGHYDWVKCEAKK